VFDEHGFDASKGEDVTTVFLTLGDVLTLYHYLRFSLRHVPEPSPGNGSARTQQVVKQRDRMSHLVEQLETRMLDRGLVSQEWLHALWAREWATKETRLP
jgi:hypothetical protein